MYSIEFIAGSLSLLRKTEDIGVILHPSIKFFEAITCRVIRISSLVQSHEAGQIHICRWKGHVRSKRTFSNGEDNSWLYFRFPEEWTARLDERCADPQVRRIILPHCNKSFTSEGAVISRSPKDARRKRKQSGNSGRFAVFAEFIAALEGKRSEVDSARLTPSGPFVLSVALKNFWLLWRLSTPFLPKRVFGRSRTNPAGDFAEMELRGNDVDPGPSGSAVRGQSFSGLLRKIPRYDKTEKL
jgi:hypothetical protein